MVSGRLCLAERFELSDKLICSSRRVQREDEFERS